MPTILDKNGRELTVGSRVCEAKPYADTLEVLDIIGQEIGTRHPRSQTYARFWASRADRRGTYRCNELELLTEAVQQAAPESEGGS